MKLKLIFYLSILLFPIISFADHFTMDQQMFFSQLDEKYSKDIENSDIWALYIRTFGSEKIMVRFPFMPKLKCYDQNHFCIQSSDKNVQYKLFVDSFEKMDSEKIIDEKIASVEKARSLKLESIKKSKDHKHDILDLTYSDNRLSGTGEKTIFSMHVIVSDTNVYTLLSQYPEKQENGHGYFIHSFEILTA